MILAMGVTVSFASDMGCPYLYHGENARELACCVELGMTPMAAIVSATKTAAQAVGLEDKIGTVEEGKLADLLLIDGDPVRNIEILCQKEKIKMVMKEGEIIIAKQ